MTDKLVLEGCDALIIIRTPSHLRCFDDFPSYLLALLRVNVLLFVFVALGFYASYEDCALSRRVA